MGCWDHLLHRCDVHGSYSNPRAAIDYIWTLWVQVDTLFWHNMGHLDVRLSLVHEQLKLGMFASKMRYSSLSWAVFPIKWQQWDIDKLLKSGSGKDCHHQESWDSFRVISALFVLRCIFFPVDKSASVWAWVAMMWNVDDPLIKHAAACYKDWPSIRATHITLTAFVHEVCDQAFWKSWQFAVALRSLLDMGGGELILIVQLSEYERRQRS